jgi:hypothetical protein
MLGYELQAFADQFLELAGGSLTLRTTLGGFSTFVNVTTYGANEFLNHVRIVFWDE